MSLPVRALLRALPSVTVALTLSAGVGGVGLSACVVRLNDPYKEYPANGDVTGEPAACTGPAAEGGASQTGPKSARIIGRTATTKDDPAGTTRIVWSGTAVSARFSGAQNVFVKLAVTGDHVRTDTNNDAQFAPASIYYSVTVDGAAATLVTVDGTKGGEQVLPLATGLDSGPHEITLVRESDVAAGAHLYYGLFSDAAGKAKLNYLPATLRPRRIQIIGDSIACGSGVLGANATCGFDYETERVSSAFGSLAASTLDAEVSTIATRTVRVFVDPNAGGTDPLISDLYSCADPSVAPCIGAGDLSKDPTPPSVIVLTLGANDLARANVDLGGFQDTYLAFVTKLRSTYPKAHIFCTVSPLITDLNTSSLRTKAKLSLRNIVAALADQKIYALDFPDQGTENGLGCEDNPSPKTHQIMASILATAIREKTCW
jgi:lysophospholipase L1-like esterase